MDKSDQINELCSALCKAQSEFKIPKKRADNPFFKSKYADLGEIIDCVHDALINNGFSYCQFPIHDGSLCGVETILMHKSGQWLSGKTLLNISKQDPQACGSAITYARRYSLQAILGLPAEDDDGNSATFEESHQNFHQPDKVISKSYENMSCSRCSVPVAEKVKDFSSKKYGHVLCFDCQKEA